MTRKLTSKKELKSVYGIPYCFAHIARLEAAGEFPKRVKLGACRVAWVAEEVEDWIEERIATRAQTSPS
jgi:prophage regulatory protein